MNGKHQFGWCGAVYRIQVNRQVTDINSMRFSSIDDFINDRLAEVSLTAGDPGHGTRATQLGFFVQDNYKVSSNLAIDFGVRWDAETGPHDSKYKTQTFNPSSGTLAPPGSPYFEMNKRNFAPRLGIVWSPIDPVVVRASMGVFYQAYPVGFGAYNVPLNNVPGNTTCCHLRSPT